MTATQPDPRYLVGAAAIYANMAAIEVEGSTADDFMQNAIDFVRTHVEWHERNRWCFRPHPSWRQHVLG